MPHKILSTGRKVDGDLSYTPTGGVEIAVVYGYDQFARDLNDEDESYWLDTYIGSQQYGLVTKAERIEIARWQIERWQEYIDRLETTP